MSNFKQVDMLENYDVSKYVTPDGYTSDIAIFTIISEQGQGKKKPATKTLKLMLIKRAEQDSEGRLNIEAGKWALPGGFVDAKNKETALQAAERELQEETGVTNVFLKHFGVYDKFGRDPRGWIISNAHYAIVPESCLKERKASDDAAEVEIFSIEQVFDLPLAFDHEKIIKEALSFIEKDMVQSTVAKNFLPDEFTLSELQRVLLTVTDGTKIATDSIFFARAPKLPFLEKVVTDSGEMKKTQRNSPRPSQLYRFNDVSITKSIWE
ncbi:NUDIX domain-containing protein [Aquibacillus rhizosphaerae]|uniref:NUDIX domain-containing protein n=1 Tax=Aquibacillus rhizosphaerae TaxID=3051431 RepID=A0ABT7L1X5_9BACI|nr:NUDIX domain-containing protein [Aquibacillus sp. LR5S19]MDL4839834.1 NUDIX domain-containing protein [Aquibacillus sp. LR5S19]